MSKPWHGEIAALSRLHLIRDNMGERDGGGGGDGEEEKQSGRRDTGHGGRGCKGWWWLGGVEW